MIFSYQVVFSIGNISLLFNTVRQGGNGGFLGFQIPKNPMKIRKIPGVP
jgi:hypothetical protein